MDIEATKNVTGKQGRFNNLGTVRPTPGRRIGRKQCLETFVLEQSLGGVFPSGTDLKGEPSFRFLHLAVWHRILLSPDLDFM
jgi:hypothetical protein